MPCHYRKGLRIRTWLNLRHFYSLTHAIAIQLQNTPITEKSRSIRHRDTENPPHFGLGPRVGDRWWVVLAAGISPLNKIM
jgi:hypothetical protein